MPALTSSPSSPTRARLPLWWLIGVGVGVSFIDEGADLFASRGTPAWYLGCAAVFTVLLSVAILLQPRLRPPGVALARRIRLVLLSAAAMGLLGAGIDALLDRLS